MRIARVLFLLLVAALMAGRVSARETMDQRIEALLPGMDVVKPKGHGPFPVFIQFHGCGGKKALQADWAAVAKEAGWAAIVVDSYRHRRISTLEAYTTVCTGLQLWGQERAGDLYAAMEWARRQPWADKNRIVVAGWSHGGWTALDAMSLKPGDEAAHAFLVYPFAGPGSIAPGRGLRVDVSPLAIVGLSDVIVGGRGLAATLRRTKTPATPIEIIELEGATHAFDEKEARDMRVRYAPDLVARAHGLLRDYLAAVIARTS
jgi:dienelactone hydrolase